VARGVNTRSTMWAGPRGGASLAAACLRLLERSPCSLWPWAKFQRGILGEAFPAAQLRHWNLPHQRYAGRDAVKIREVILEDVRSRLRVNKSHADLAVTYADALDAIIAAFAAIAIANGTVTGFKMPSSEGFVAVHP
jgi:hypothetical protein